MLSQEERRAAEEAANAARLAAQRAKSEVKVKMKGKNKPSRRHKKKQGNIIEEKKPQVQARMKEQGDRKQAVVAKAKEVPADVPRALHAFFK